MDRDQGKSVPEYGNGEERRVITKIETPVAKKLGEPTRRAWRGNKVKTKGPTSKEKNEEPKSTSR